MNTIGLTMRINIEKKLKDDGGFFVTEELHLEIPEELYTETGWEDGTVVEVEWEDGHLVLRNVEDLELDTAFAKERELSNV